LKALAEGFRSGKSLPGMFKEENELNARLKGNPFLLFAEANQDFCENPFHPGFHQ
jgi:hypothetical protein